MVVFSFKKIKIILFYISILKLFKNTKNNLK
jgi:hypothetical protein